MQFVCLSRPFNLTMRSVNYVPQANFMMAVNYGKKEKIEAKKMDVGSNQETIKNASKMI